MPTLAKSPWPKSVTAQLRALRVTRAYSGPARAQSAGLQYAYSGRRTPCWRSAAWATSIAALISDLFMVLLQWSTWCRAIVAIGFRLVHANARSDAILGRRGFARRTLPARIASRSAV